MSTTASTTRDEVVEAIREDLSGIEEKVHTTSLADLIRAGSVHTVKKNEWGEGDQACALAAGALGAVALGVISDEG